MFKGRTYDSRLEKAVAEELEWRKRAGEFTEIKEQFPVTYYVNGHKVAKNIIDFKCERPDGTILFVEAKGAESERYRILKQLAIALLDEIYPGCDYQVVKGSYRSLKWLKKEKLVRV